jgi:hypothetical protein
LDAVRDSCPLSTPSGPVVAIDGGSQIEPPSLTGITDLDSCLASGLRIRFSHNPPIAPVHYELFMDQVMVLPDITPPEVIYVPPDSGNHRYFVRALHDDCGGYRDSSHEWERDDNRRPAAPTSLVITDLDPCAPSLAQIVFAHAGFPEGGHYELWRDGELFLSPIENGTLFAAGDDLPHQWRVDAVDASCSIRSSSGEVAFAETTNCDLGEANLRVERTGDNSFLLSWTHAAGTVWSYNAYTGTLAGIDAGAYDHVKQFAGILFPDSSNAFTGCDAAGGRADSARLWGVPFDEDLYFLVVAAGPAGEGPYGAGSSGVDRHDPAVDPRPPENFCP